jgi:glutathione-regulated potassium-efflux system ancillary protein KefF
MILVIHAHPYPRHSRANTALLNAVRDLPDVEVHSLYELYPDFDIDVPAEQAALTRADLVVWLHPIYWYSVPALLKHWFESVLTRGWAYGGEAHALAGKSCLWVCNTGGDVQAYTPQGIHQRPFADFVAPIEQTARFCQMHWLPPLVIHGAHAISDDVLATHAADLRARLVSFAARQKAGAA